MPRKLIAIDLDGTLLHSNGTLGEKQLAACKAASRHSIVAIATGRRPGKATEILSGFDFPYYLISSSGCRLNKMPDGETLFRHFLHPSIVRSILKAVEASGLSAILFCDVTTDSDLKLYRGKTIHPVLEHYIESQRRFYMGEISSIDTEMDSVHYVTSIGDEQSLEVFQASLTPALRSTINYHLIRNLSIPGAAFDMLPKHATKWNAIQYLAGHLNIPLSNTVAIGDDFNDIDMIRNAGISIAMGNARPEIIDLAHHTTDTNDNDGVSQAFKDILDIC